MTAVGWGRGARPVRGGRGVTGASSAPTSTPGRIAQAAGEAERMRGVFALYLTLIVAGVAFYAVIGLTHN
ncbi:MAG: hypothetical protein ACRDGE_08360 [Candidatus Limnocylindria bacterium]